MEPNLSLTDPADKLLYRRALDLCDQAVSQYTDRYTTFLDPHQQAVCQLACQQAQREGQELSFTFFGGFPDAQRRMLGVFCQYSDPQEAEPPIQGVTFTFRREDSLTHRDFLGCILGLEIKRELLGDILVEPGRAVVFCTGVAASLACQIEKVGRVGVRPQLGIPETLPAAYTLRPIPGTVSSLRLDSVCALCLGLSREKAAALVRSGAVRLNHLENTRTDQPLQEGDILSVHGHGRYLVQQIGSQSRSGRIHLVCAQYQ